LIAYQRRAAANIPTSNEVLRQSLPDGVVQAYDGVRSTLERMDQSGYAGRRRKVA
jgi:hypothetical protein